ncbi:MAG TPA: rod shape-determining protein MreC [Burkholderiaceae bacterium]|nr:rod shape-determining protein MreC [Burkholderiaceae bacterium]
MEYSPPPLFKQGASARVKMLFFTLLSLALLVVDSRLQSLTRIRQLVGMALYPVQMAVLMPRDAAYAIEDYFTSLSSLEKENKTLKHQQIANAQILQQAQQLGAENAHLRKLLGASEQLPVNSLMSEILYDTRDAFTRKIVLNRGARNGVAPGQPVIDDIGMVGQVTRVFPFTSEVTLLTDKDQAVPVQVVRSGLRSVAYGRGQSGGLELRYMPTNVDIVKDDVLVTSGIDGVYPPGLLVARVARVEHKSSDAFARIFCQPIAGIDRNRQLLILLVDTDMPPRPEVEDLKDKNEKDAGSRSLGVTKETVVKDNTKDAPPKEKLKTNPRDGVKPAVREVAKETAVGNVGAAAQGTKNNQAIKPAKAAVPAPTAVDPTPQNKVLAP